jgi:hypothetical protein
MDCDPRAHARPAVECEPPPHAYTRRRVDSTEEISQLSRATDDEPVPVERSAKGRAGGYGHVAPAEELEAAIDADAAPDGGLAEGDVPDALRPSVLDTVRQMLPCSFELATRLVAGAVLCIVGVSALLWVSELSSTQPAMPDAIYELRPSPLFPPLPPLPVPHPPPPPPSHPTTIRPSFHSRHRRRRPPAHQARHRPMPLRPAWRRSTLAFDARRMTLPSGRRMVCLPMRAS